MAIKKTATGKHQNLTGTLLRQSTSTHLTTGWFCRRTNWYLFMKGPRLCQVVVSTWAHPDISRIYSFILSSRESQQRSLGKRNYIFLFFYNMKLPFSNETMPKWLLVFLHGSPNYIQNMLSNLTENKLAWNLVHKWYRVFDSKRLNSSFQKKDHMRTLVFIYSWNWSINNLVVIRLHLNNMQF